MKHENSFSVSRFKNRNGVFSFRVKGHLNGVRIRRNFKTKEEASAEKALLEITAAQIESGRPNQLVTSLTLEQVRDAEAALRRLGAAGHSLSFCADFTLANYRKPDHEMPLADALKEYVAAKERERDQHALSACHVINIRKELKKLLVAFHSSKLPELMPQRLTAFCERGKPSLKTVNLRRGILSTFFKFAFQRDWIAVNPVDKIPRHRLTRRRSSADTLTAAKAGELMAFVESHRNGELIPFFALCLFAGIRPCLRNGEILKLRPEHIRLDEGAIVIPAEVSKVHEKRIITIQPNLAAWLRAYPLAIYPIVPTKHLRNTRALVAKQFALSKDVLRHTFISMFVAKFRSLGEAALQAGNSEAIIRKHYLDLKSAAEADAFFSILPKQPDESAAPVAEQTTAPLSHAPARTVDVQRAA